MIDSSDCCERCNRESCICFVNQDYWCVECDRKVEDCLCEDEEDVLDY